MSTAAPENGWARLPSYAAAYLRSGLNRAKGAAIPNTQTAIAATISWAICYYLLGNANPIFAPTTTFLCMGYSRNRLPRKVLQIGFGASVGVLLGGLAGYYLGFGWWQLLLLLLTAPLLGRIMDRGDVIAFQVSIQTLVVASMIGASALTGATDNPLVRVLQAVIGAGVALIATVILPTSSVTRPRRYVSLVIKELARALRRISKGLLDGDDETLAGVSGHLTAMREVLNDARQSLDSALETAAIQPAARDTRQLLAELDRMLELTERLHVTLSMMQRQGRNMVTEVGAMPELSSPMWHAADLLEQVGAGVREWRRPTDARNEAVALAATLKPAELAPDSADWRIATLTSLLRAVVVDLLELTGLSMAQARATLADIGDFDPDDTQILDSDAEEGSSVWGTEQVPAVEPPAPRPELPAAEESQPRS